jgi:hypothetical protein
MITNKVAATSAHQVNFGKKYVLKFTRDDHYNSFDVYNSERVWINPNYKKMG